MVIDTRTRLLTPGEVAKLFWVDPRTVARWAAAGRIESVRTPGGHRRFTSESVYALLSEIAPNAAPVEPHRVPRDRKGVPRRGLTA
jgi:excisionase family DNA binding protein